jgi:hypothetical protein
MARTFKHSGDMGDIVLALPTIRAMGGGILYLDPTGGAKEPLVHLTGIAKTKLNAAAIERFKPLLARVPYVTEVRLWNGEPVDVNLDAFRQHIRFNNVSDSHLAAFGLPLTERDRPWIEITDPLVDPRYPIIISRSVRYQGNHGFWESELPKFAAQAAYVGYAKDHEILEYTFGVKVHFWDAPDVVSLARVIAGSKQFICNQGLPHTLAEAMQKNMICEVYRPYPGVMFKRPNAQYV